MSSGLESSSQQSSSEKYQLREISGNLLKGENWIMWLKFIGVHIAFSIVIGLVIYLIAALLGDYVVPSAVLIIIAVFAGQMVMLSTFENWDGCYKKIEN